MITKKVITDLAGSAPYLVRWSLWLPFGWSLKLHKIVRADDDRCAHDHPWWMLRLILWGGYIESHSTKHTVAHRKPWRPWAPWRMYWYGSMFRHRILELPQGSSWTLVLCGSKSREWGFFTKLGWVNWEQFVRNTRETRVMWCDDSPTEVSSNASKKAVIV